MNLSLQVQTPAVMHLPAQHLRNYIQSSVRLNEGAARQYVEDIYAALRLLKLYRRHFAESFAQQDLSEPFMPEFTTTVESHFFEQVSQHWFPCRDSEYRSDCIDPELFSIDHEALDGGDTEYYDPVALAILGLINPDYYDAGNTFLIRTGGAPEQIDWKACTLSWERFKHSCSAHGKPWSDLPYALDRMNNDLGSIFFDYTYDYDLSQWRWNPADIRYLKRQWRHGDALARRADQFMQWLDSHPDQWPAVIALIKHNLEPRDNQKHQTTPASRNA